MTAGLTKLQQLDASLPIHEDGLRSAVVRYCLALVITVEITTLRYVLDSVLNNTSIFSFYFASVILAAWYLGLGPSLLNLVCGAVIAWVFFARRAGPCTSKIPSTSRVWLYSLRLAAICAFLFIG